MREGEGNFELNSIQYMSQSICESLDLNRPGCPSAAINADYEEQSM